MVSPWILRTRGGSRKVPARETEERRGPWILRTRGGSRKVPARETEERHGRLPVPNERTGTLNETPGPHHGRKIPADNKRRAAAVPASRDADCRPDRDAQKGRRGNPWHHPHLSLCTTGVFHAQACDDLV
ncbi:hypothetical protein NDU88_006865 [Pleurodeles waltl]|uniref:Uncharacterized protein n=1 Tax=Pleurodeles waltl TaxID=8319 RepID=A0AAV7TYB9_PLEWA|nr:hypothetical protein NDU88_006865 [Pleurodeles waltl]